MKTWRPLFVLALFTLSACGGGLSTVPPAQPGSAPAAAGRSAASAPAAAMRRPGQPQEGRLVFHITLPRVRRGKHSHFIPASSQSITITLNTVNGGAPPTQFPRSVNSSLNPAHCGNPCTVDGPWSPPGSDNFTVTVLGGPVGTPGPALSTATQTFTILNGKANAPSITLLGVPAQFALHATMPAGAGGNAFATPAPLPIDVKDADGDVITGTYSAPVTLTDPDATSLTACSGLCGSALKAGSGSISKSVAIASSTAAATVTLVYGGMDVLPVTLRASTAAGALTLHGAATFSPSVASIVYTGPQNEVLLPELDLYAISGTGSTGAFTDSQAGWSTSPYSQSIGENDDCSTIATFAQTLSGTSWTATAVADPSAGTCTATLTGGAGATLGISTTYTTTAIGVDAAHKPKR
jgi:hypothetical protein